MNKTVGNISVGNSLPLLENSQINIVKKYNPSITESIRLDGLDEINDTIYALNYVKSKIEQANNKG